MSGIPERRENDGQIAALRRELQLTWQSHEREHSQHDAAHSREHQFTAEALKVAADLAKENKEDSNEWRGSMNDREAKFATKDDVRAIMERLDKIERAGLVRDERERLEKEESGRRQTRSMWTVGIMATLGGILVSAVLRLSGN